MSSLRIPGANSAPRDPAVGGEAGRSETPTGRDAFAAVLGIAGEAAAAGTTDAAPDPGNSGAPANSDPRKRSDGDAKAGLALAAAASILAPPAVLPAIPDALTSPLEAAAASSVAVAASDVAIAATAGDKPVVVGSFEAAVGSPESTRPSTISTGPAPDGLMPFSPSPAAAAGTEPAPGGVVARNSTPSATAASPASIGDPAAEPASPASVVAVSINSDPTQPAAPPAAPPIPAAGAVGAPPILAAPDANLGETGGGDAFGSGDRDQGQSAFAAHAGDAAAAAAVGGGVPALPAATPDGAPATVASADAVAAGIADQTSSHVLHMVASGARDITVQLHPPELGALTVRIEVSGRDVSTWFDSALPEVQRAISAGIGQLRTDLGSAGYTLNGAFVGGGASGGQARSGNFAPPQAARTAALAGFTASGTPSARPSASGVSIYV